MGGDAESEMGDPTHTAYVCVHVHVHVRMHLHTLHVPLFTASLGAYSLAAA